MKTLTVVNQKSIGKTTIVFHLSNAGADFHQLRVLLVSFDALC